MANKTQFRIRTSDGTEHTIVKRCIGRKVKTDTGRTRPLSLITHVQLTHLVGTPKGGISLRRTWSSIARALSTKGGAK